MTTVHCETLSNGVNLEVIKILDGRRYEIHCDGAYRGAPMMMAFRGSHKEAQEEYRRIKQREKFCS